MSVPMIPPAQLPQGMGLLGMLLRAIQHDPFGGFSPGGSAVLKSGTPGAKEAFRQMVPTRLFNALERRPEDIRVFLNQVFNTPKEGVTTFLPTIQRILQHGGKGAQQATQREAIDQLGVPMTQAAQQGAQGVGIGLIPNTFPTTAIHEPLHALLSLKRGGAPGYLSPEHSLKILQRFGMPSARQTGRTPELFLQENAIQRLAENVWNTSPLPPLEGLEGLLGP